MKIAETFIRATQSRQFTLYPVGDMHLEKTSFDEERFKRYVDIISQDENAAWVFVGDAIEGRTPRMKHYDPDVIRPEYKFSDYVFRVQEKLKELYEPLRKVPGFVVQGNHDAYLEWVGISQYLAAISGGQYLAGEGLFRLNVDMGSKSRTFVGYATHGSGGGAKAGSKYNKVEDLQYTADADFYFMGHVHDSFARIPTKFTIPRRGELKLVPVHRAFIVAPSFLKSRMENTVDYSGAKAYSGVDTGIIVLDIDAENGRFYRREIRL